MNKIIKTFTKLLTIKLDRTNIYANIKSKTFANATMGRTGNR